MLDREKKPSDISSGLNARATRRNLLKAAAVLLPTIVTLRVRSAAAKGREDDGLGSKNNPIPVLNQLYVDQSYRYGPMQRGNTFGAWSVDTNTKDNNDAGQKIYKVTQDLQTPDGIQIKKKKDWVTFRTTP